MTIPEGLCQCGCGGSTAVLVARRPGYQRGEHRRFRQGHYARAQVVEPHITSTGYVAQGTRRRPNGRTTPRLEHIEVVERALGHPLPVGAVVHHIDADRANNANSTLVACQDNAYHHTLHRRQRALAACGHADWRKCWICKQWDEPTNLKVRSSTARHRTCERAYERQWEAKQRDTLGRGGLR